mmetsp:Transcript_4467/g.10763  ORF Transcript_4467/g.10763 Transcript_4467/m.10763 type:complete len:227 (-) Transcript_4467:204-884(-)
MPSRPSSPTLFLPHTQSEPSLAMAVEKWSPQERNFIGGASATRCGTRRSVLFPWPSLPCSPTPHVKKRPSSTSAAECVPPHATCVTLSPANPSTSLGSWTWSLDPWPSAPTPPTAEPPKPHEYTLPSSVSASACWYPAATCTTLTAARAATATGSNAAFPADGTPSSPCSLLPIENTFPDCVTKSVNFLPHATSLTFSAVSISVGVCTFLTSPPSPSAPTGLNPAT